MYGSGIASKSARSSESFPQTSIDTLLCCASGTESNCWIASVGISGSRPRRAKINGISSMNDVFCFARRWTPRHMATTPLRNGRPPPHVSSIQSLTSCRNSAKRAVTNSFVIGKILPLWMQSTGVLSKNSCWWQMHDAPHACM